MRFALLGFALLVLDACQGCNCGAKPLVKTECKFTVEPSGSGNEIQFAATPVGGQAERSYRVTNTGTGVTLTELHTTFEARNGDNYSADIPVDTRITPGDDQTFVVTFHPLVEAELASSFVVSHPDVGSAKCPTATVFVRGTGFEPQEVDAGFPDAGEEDAGTPADAGPDVDAGTVQSPDGGVVLGPNAEWFAYGAFEEARARFAAVELKDGSGDILAVGGYGEDGVALDSIERFNPQTGVSRVVAHMAVPRAEPAAVVLPGPEAKVMILGGRSAAQNGVAVRTVEIFDPLNGDTVACADPGGCGLGDQDGAALPVGRIGAVASATSTGVMLMLGKTLDTDGNSEIDVAGGELVTTSPTLSATALGNENLLTAREGAAVVADSAGDGTLLVIGGTSGEAATQGDVLDDILLVDGATHSVGTLGSLPATSGPRSFASATELSTGDVLVAGGFGGTGVGLDGVVRITAAFGNGPVIEDLDVQITPRVGGSLVALGGDILLWAGGMTRRTDNLDAVDSELPQTSADVLVPLGATTLLRLSTDNQLAQGRFEHQALAISSDGSGGADKDIALFLGGVSTAPRRTPHPHIERFLRDENRFLTYGLMGGGTAIEAGVLGGATPSGAALVSAGGVDPHTGRTSSAVRAFDAQNGVFVEDGDLRQPRSGHTLTRISVDEDNVMLVAGGKDENGVTLSSLSFYDTVAQVDRPLPVSLHAARSGHTATRLADGNPIADGAVLLCGGQGQGGEALDSCEVFVPPSNTLDPNTYDEAQVLPVLGRMSTGRVGHTATLLDTGEVLLVGGGDVTVDLVTADLFVPDATQPFLRATGQPVKARTGHAAVFIGSGRVLVVGGLVFDTFLGATRSAELYVRASESFLALPDMEDERASPAAFLLGDGNVLVAGGSRQNTVNPDVPTRSNRTSELYVVGGDGTGTFEPLPDAPLSFGRSDVRFLDVFGRAVVTGGDHRDGIVETGDERRTPITFVDFLQDPLDAIGP